MLLIADRMNKNVAVEPARWQAGEQGELLAPSYGDVYASRSGAWGQAQSVFIEGCDLADHLAQHASVRLLETGFGLGVNFLSTWAYCRGSGRPARLRYVSIEKHPFTRDDLRAALELLIVAAPPALSPALPVLAAQLVAAWPPLIPGFHTILLDEQTTLTLIFGDIEQTLPSVCGKFDAFYLDGFAPDRNPAMWSDRTLSQLAALAAPGARLATWCVAGHVRRALTTAGFSVGKRAGYGSKRESLAAHWPADPQSVKDISEALVIGAGIAGASMARQLAARGIAVTVIDKALPASGASGNPVAVVRPEPGGADNPIAEFSAAGVIWLRRWLALHERDVPHAFCGALRMTRDQRRHDKLAAHSQMMPDEWLQELDLQQARQVCGQEIADPAFLLPWSAWVQPSALVNAMLDHPLITVRTGLHAHQLSRWDAGGWALALSDGSRLQASIVILANAFGELSPVPLALDRARGQLSSVPAREGQELRAIVCRDGYITPAVNGLHTIGATIQYDDDDGSPRESDDAENFQRLQRLLPGFAQYADYVQSGRVSWRATTQDRLPMVGKLADGLYASLAHGSRGIACAPLCAEFLAAMMLDEPLPLGAAWVARLDPLRFRP